MRPKNVLRENPAVVAVAAVVVAVAGHAAGKPLTNSIASRASPHFFELRDDVDGCRIAGF